MVAYVRRRGSRESCCISERGDQGMYRRLYPWMFLLGGVLIGVVISGRMAVRGRASKPPSERPEPRRLVGGAIAPPVGRIPPLDAVASLPSRDTPRGGTASVQDVLLRPYRFPFNQPTTLTQVCLHLKQTLGVPVVLDIAALERQDVDADDTVQLELDGVRLKTGLKLLLDQVGLTYQVVPDDNLLIVTDRQGSEDPLDRVWTELRSLHRDLHDVQDTVDELADALYGEEAGRPEVAQADDHRGEAGSRSGRTGPGRGRAEGAERPRTEARQGRVPRPSAR